MIKENVAAWIDANREIIENVAMDLWENPELAFEEVHAAKTITKVLADNGFKIEREVAGLKTAFVAEYGSGKPIIGILGEFDALRGQSQEVSAIQKPVKKGAPGHGCGHNLIGSGCLGAVLGIKQAIASGEITGTIRYYGCPGEEAISGKVYMASAKVFDDLDVALTWHPGNINAPSNAAWLAVDSIKFKFHGISAHAAATPDAGRSALDAVELMNVGANYLREHVSDKVRFHYVITNGGEAPNIVPDEAEVWYYVRAPKKEEVSAITKRLLKIAKGATLMTETSIDVELEAGCYEFMPNKTLGEVFVKNLLEAGGPDFSEDDLKFAAELSNTIPEAGRFGICAFGVPAELASQSLHWDILESFGEGMILPGSTDVGDVSAIVPTAQMHAASWPMGVPPHSWQSTAASGSGIGLNSTVYAAKMLAATACDLFSDSSLIEKAKKEFLTYADPATYKPGLPGSVDLSGLD